MVLTIDNLRRGMQDWVSRPRWPRDFHASLYPTLARLQYDGLSPEWWHPIVNHLADWKAIRPLSKATIVQTGMPLLASLTVEKGAIIQSSRPRPPSLDTCNWDQIAGLYDVAQSIKGASTPVFGSKLCHFILPDVFAVIDGDFIGVSPYRAYWERCKEEWISCQDRQPLVAVVSACIQSSDASSFPWTTKITELCIAGSRAL